MPTRPIAPHRCCAPHAHGAAPRIARGTGWIVSVDGPSARARPASLRWMTSVIVKIVYASSIITTRAGREMGDSITWSTTQHSERPMTPSSRNA